MFSAVSTENVDEYLCYGSVIAKIKVRPTIEFLFICAGSTMHNLCSDTMASQVILSFGS